MKIYGAALSYVFVQFIVSVVLFTYFKKHCKSHEMKFEESFTEIMAVLPSHALDFIRIWPNTYLPYLTFDANTYMLAMLKDNNFTAAFGVQMT